MIGETGDPLTEIAAMKEIKLNHFKCQNEESELKLDQSRRGRVGGSVRFV